MYKDVKKKILAVVLCICMVIGAVEIVPRVQAAATADANGYYTIKASISGATNTYSLKVSLGCETTRNYNNTAFRPVLAGVWDSMGTEITNEFNRELKVLDNGDNVNSGTFYCTIQPSSNSSYTISSSLDENKIAFTINSVEVKSLNVDTGISGKPILKYDANGAKPTVQSVKAILNDSTETEVILSSNQYELSGITTVGRNQSSTVKIVDTDGNFTNDENITTTVICDVAYDLADFATLSTSQFTYSGRDLRSEVAQQLQIRNTSNNIVQNGISTTSTEFNVAFNSESVTAVGDNYTIEVTPSGGENKATDINGNLYTGKFSGTFSVVPMSAGNIEVSALDTDQSKRVELSDDTTVLYRVPLSKKNSNGEVLPIDMTVKVDGTQLGSDDYEISFEDDKRPTTTGSYTMIITPKPKTGYSGTKKVTYYVYSTMTVDNYSFLLYGNNVNELYYTGSGQQLEKLVVKSEGTTLIKDIHYTIKFQYMDGQWTDAASNTADEMGTVGEKRIVITGIAAYKGEEITLPYSVKKVSMNDTAYENNFSLTIDTDKIYYYAGKNVEVIPDYKFTYNGTVVKEEYYEVECTNNTSAGEATLTVKAAVDGPFEGSLSTTFTIQPLNLSNAELVGDGLNTDNSKYSYTGSPIIPGFKIGSYVLETSDYTASYINADTNETLTSAPIARGNYKVTISSNNSNITGTKTLSFSIIQRDISKDTDASFMLALGGDREIEWNGGETKPEVIHPTTMEKGTDFTVQYEYNTAPTTTTSACAIIVGQNNYTGEKRIDFTITRRNITDDNVKVTPSISGNGSLGLEPPYNVVLNVEDIGNEAIKKSLTEGTDYQIKSIVYKTEKDYTVTDLSSLERAGEYEITIEGKDKYKGTQTVTVTCGTDISDAPISLGTGTFTYNGEEQYPMIKVRIGTNNVSLKMGDDTDRSPFKPVFSRSADDEDTVPFGYEGIYAGTVYVQAEGNTKQGYYGTTIEKKTFTINPMNISSLNTLYKVDFSNDSNADIRGGNAYYQFTNEVIVPLVRVMKDDTNSASGAPKELTEGVDYTVSYEGDCISKRSHKVIVTGKGNFIGTIPGTFYIEGVDISDSKIRVDFTADSINNTYLDGAPIPEITFGSSLLVNQKDYTYLVEAQKKDANSTWNDTWVYDITGLKNFADSTRRETHPITKTTLVAASDPENPQIGEVYISGWKDKITIKPGETLSLDDVKSKIILTYCRKNGELYTMEEGIDFEVSSVVSDNKPGTGTTIKVTGIGGCQNTIQFGVVLYTDINTPDFLKDDSGNYTGKLYPGATITVTELKEALENNNGDLASLVTFGGVWNSEGGTVPTNCYSVMVPNNYTPQIGDLTLTVAGNEEGYYTNSRRFTVKVTGSLSEGNPTVTIGTGNTVPYKGEVVTPQNTAYSVYDGTNLLKGIDEDTYNADKDAYVDYDYTIRFEESTGIGLAKAVITGINKYSGQFIQPFKITYSIEKLTVKIMNAQRDMVVYQPGMSYPFNLDPDSNKPTIELYYTDNGAITDEDQWKPVSTDFCDIAYEGNTQAGTAYIYISESTNDDYKGILYNNKKLNYILTKLSIDKDEGQVRLVSMNYTPKYTGNEITTTSQDGLGLVLAYDDYTLEEGTDYDVQLYNNVNVSTDQVVGTMVITGKGNFSGSRTETFRIQPISLASQTDVSVSAESVIYTGNPEKPSITIRQQYGQQITLTEGVDYEIKEYTNGGSITQSPDTPFSKVGDYYVVVKGKGNYSGERSILYSIIQRSVEDGLQISFVHTDACPVINGAPNCVYNGSEHEPAVKVIYNGVVLKGPSDSATPDYRLNYHNNTNVGTATVTVTGNGSFTGSSTLEFKIQPKDIAGVDLQYLDGDGNTFENEKSYEFTGEVVEPTISVVDSAMPTAKATLVRDENYAIAYTDHNEDNNGHYNAGKVTMTITGIGNYGGTKEFTYYIGEDISKSYALVNGKSSVSVIYNGLKQAPDESAITVVSNGVTLTDDNGEKRYDIAYYKNGFEYENLVSRDKIVDAGTYYVAIVGVPTKGTYAKSGISNSCIYEIKPRSISPSYIKVSGFNDTYYYTGQEIVPKGIVVEDTQLPANSAGTTTRTVQLVNGTDYELSYAGHVYAGKATITVTGKGNYEGTREAYFTIISSDVTGNNTWDGTSEGTGSLTSGTSTISASNITLGYDNSAYDCMMYTGYARIPTVSIDGVSADQYTVSASNNINPGVATLVITGAGKNYTGKIIMNYVIKANLGTHGSIAAIADQVYTGYQITPGLTLTCGGNLLNQGSDYTVTYANNINVGTATVIAYAASDSYYIGSITGTFNISNTAGGMQITGYASSYTYSGYPITPDVVVTMNGRVLNRGTDYTVSYSNNINVGTATMTVTGIGSFSGTQTIYYTIEAKNIENCLTTAVTNYQYTGNTYTPNVTITDSSTGKTLVAGTDYTITYSNNTNPGTASITVTALSKNYTGTKVIPFKITSAAVSGLRTSTIKNNSIKLAWSAQDYADGYQICNSKNQVVATTRKNSYTVKGLTSCTTYKFKVRSYVENADGSISYGNFSTAVSAKTLLNTPTLKVKSTSKGKVTLTWTKVTKATGYEIYYSTKKNGVYTRLKTISKSSKRQYVDAGLASGEKYYYTIRAYRTANGVKTYSSYNTIKSVKVK